MCTILRILRCQREKFPAMLADGNKARPLLAAKLFG